MSSKMLAAAGVAVVVAIGAYFYTQSSDQSDHSDSAMTAQLRSHIPADSLAFMLNEKAIPLELMVNADPSIEQLAQMADAAVADQAQPALVFWAHLGSAYMRALQSGTEHLKSDWGFADEIYSAMYFVGLAPVAELSLAAPAKFTDHVRAAANAANLTLDTTTEGSAQIHRVTFYENEGQKLTLLMRESEGWLRLALELPGSEASADLLAGTQLPKQSLANSDLLQQVYEQFDLRGDLVAVTNIAALAATLTDPQSTAGDMLSKMLPELDLSGWQTPACQEEMATLTAAVPQWSAVGDMNYDESQPRAVTSKIEALLSIRNEKLAASLAKLNGVLPDFSAVDDHSPLYSFALGLNVAQFAPVLMELHQSAMQHSFACTYLQTAQAKLREANPAMLGMATAMVSGVKGMSFTLNSLSIGDDMQSVESASALVSLSTESVRQLLMLVQGFAPELAQLDIPEDGTAVPLRSAMLPPQVPPLHIAIKDDQHAVIMTGDDLAKRLADTFSGKGLESNGFASISMDAGELMRLADKNMQQGVPMMAAMDANTCAEMAIIKGTYKNMDLAFSGEMHFANNGVLATGDFEQAIPESSGLKLQPGTYDALQMQQGCQPVPQGTRTFAADGSGTTTSVFTDSQCDAAKYQAEFNWQQSGLGLHYIYLRERERQSCNGDWSQWQEVEEGNEESCVLTEAGDDSFGCVVAEAEGSSKGYIFRRTQ